MPLNKKEEIIELSKLMIKTMRFYSGVCLSAPQVGIHYRMFIIKHQANDKVFLNPEVVYKSECENNALDACLSFPGMTQVIKRPSKIEIKYFDENFKEQKIEADGFFARCILHEMDHLNGALLIDHLSRLKKEIIVKKMKKRKGLK